jgi:hypothetical protein
MPSLTESARGRLLCVAALQVRYCTIAGARAGPSIFIAHAVEAQLAVSCRQHAPHCMSHLCTWRHARLPLPFPFSRHAFMGMDMASVSVMASNPSYIIIYRRCPSLQGGTETEGADELAIFRACAADVSPGLKGSAHAAWNFSDGCKSKGELPTACMEA